MLRGRNTRRNSSPAMVRASDTTAFLDSAEKTKKKLSFKEPEILGYYMQMKQGVANRLSKRIKAKNDTKAVSNGLSKSCIFKNQGSKIKCNGHSNGAFGGSTEDLDLENQTLQVVRCVGQAFEENPRSLLNSRISDDDEEQSDDDLVSIHKDDELQYEKNNIDFVRSESQNQNSPQRPNRLEVISPLSSATNGVNDQYLRMNGIHASSTNTGIQSLGSQLALDASRMNSGTLHELQLLRAQVEQQTHQTQTAVSQVHLLKDQLVAETAARLEAQARTHQLLIHNKELLDHIASLVNLLQQQEKLYTQQQQKLRLHSQIQQSQLNYPSLQSFSSLPPIPTSRPTSFNFGYPSANDQFQAQLAQQIQNFNNTYQCQRYNSLYESKPNSFNLYVPQINATSLTGVSRNSSYSSSSNVTHAPIETVNETKPDDPPSTKPSSTGKVTTINDEENRVKIVAPKDGISLSRSQKSPVRNKCSKETIPLKLGHNVSKTTTNPQKVIGNRTEGVRKPVSKLPVGSLITRTSSEKVQHRSELMSQVQRKAWARHTTK